MVSDNVLTDVSYVYSVASYHVSLSLLNKRIIKHCPIRVQSPQPRHTFIWLKSSVSRLLALWLEMCQLRQGHFVMMKWKASLCITQ